MAILYTGCATTQKIFGTGLGAQNIFAVENGRGSNVLVMIRRLAVLLDPNEGLLTAVKPIITAYQSTFVFTSQFGATILEKGYFDSTQTSDSNVRIWSAGVLDSGFAPLAATNNTRGWREFSPCRLHTSAGIDISQSADIMPQLLSDTTYNYTIYPGESLVVAVEPAAVTSDPSSNNWLVNCVWTEETLTTYTISGTVTLSATPVDGAEVTVIVADDTNLTNPYLHSIQVTAGGGLWSAAIPAGKIAYAYAQNFDAGTYYTAPGNPYIS